MATTQDSLVYVNQIVLSNNKEMFATDVCGDERLRNQFGAVVGELATLNLDLQSASDEAVEKNIINYRLQPELRAKTDGVLFFAAGKLQPVILANFQGRFDSGGFTSDDPLVTREPVDAKVGLRALGLQSTAELTVSGSRLSYQTATSAVLRGHLTGTIRHADVMATLIPALAAEFTTTLNENPGSPLADQISAHFHPTHNGSGWLLTAAQLARNAIIQHLFAPDVQIYGSEGRYDPDPMGSSKDSLSFGIGFALAEMPFIIPSDPTRAQLLEYIVRDHVVLGELAAALQPLVNEVSALSDSRLQFALRNYERALNIAFAVSRQLSQTKEQIIQQPGRLWLKQALAEVQDARQLPMG